MVRLDLQVVGNGEKATSKGMKIEAIYDINDEFRQIEVFGMV